MAGSIEKRGDSYRLVYFAGYNLNGKIAKKTKTVHCNSLKEAKIELAKFVADCEKGMYIEGKSLKFTDFVEIWKRDYGSKEFLKVEFFPTSDISMLIRLNLLTLCSSMIY